MGYRGKAQNRCGMRRPVPVGNAVEGLSEPVDGRRVPQGRWYGEWLAVGKDLNLQETKWFWNEVSVESKSGLDWRIFWMLSTA